MIKRCIFIVALSVLLWPALTMADGCQFVDIQSADVQVRATAQRAVLWQRSGVWEIHIMPVFERHKAKAAWVVPFPVLPTIKESSADFFNELELLTAPMFIEACVRGGSGCDGAGSGSGSGGEDANSTGTGTVEIWDQGTIGDLDYVVITAEQQVYMVDWLKTNGYHVTSLAEASLRKFETEGTFFFAAKISESADPTKPVAPVRFVLPDLQAPMYPLVLTGLGVPDGATLELTLWLIAPGRHYYIPTSHRYDTLPDGISTADEYTSALRRFYRTHRSGTLALLYSQDLGSNVRINKRVCSGRTCVSFADMGIEAPDTWCAEINDIATNHDTLYRYQGRLGPVNLSEDLTFGILPDDERWDITANVYFLNTCAPDPGPCGDND